MRLSFLLLAPLLIAAAGGAQGEGQTVPNDTQLDSRTADYRQIPLKTITEDTTTLAEYAGQVLLLVNVATKCGNTPQYEGLEALYRKYKDRGFAVIGFPANNFKEQEPGTDAEILAFCQHTYDVTFPLMSKISVKGENQHPLYHYLTAESPQPGDIAWNFEKFLLDREGRVVARFTPKTQPDDPRLVMALEETLAKPH